MLREQVNAAIEEQRKAKVVGTSLGARVTIGAAGDEHALLVRHASDLPMLFIVSEVEVRADPSARPYTIAVTRASGEKCNRCWRYVPTRSGDGICERCQDALMQTARS
jgi:isoleucyl-tRNA synthetase